MEALPAAALTNLDIASVSEYPSGEATSSHAARRAFQNNASGTATQSVVCPTPGKKLTRYDRVRGKLLRRRHYSPANSMRAELEPAILLFFIFLTAPGVSHSEHLDGNLTV